MFSLPSLLFPLLRVHSCSGMCYVLENMMSTHILNHLLIVRYGIAIAAFIYNRIAHSRANYHLPPS